MEQINMRKYTMRKSSAALLAVLLAGCLVACGKKTTNTDAGMEAISAQNYEQARTCFDKAILEGEDLQLAYRGQGLAYMGQTDYESAIESFDRALQNGGMFVSDREVDINYYLATAQYKTDNCQMRSRRLMRSQACVRDRIWSIICVAALKWKTEIMTEQSRI